MLAEEYAAYLHGERVALVGGYGEPSEEELADYSVVVRCNNHWRRQAGRIDALYHNGFKEQWKYFDVELAKSGLKYIISNADTGLHAAVRAWGREHKIPVMGFTRFDPPEQHPSPWLLDLYKRIPVPSIGAIALYHLLLQPLNELYVTGMNLSTHLKASVDNSHGWDKHARLFSDLEKEDARLSFSKTLAQAIEELLDLPEENGLSSADTVQASR